MEIPQCPICLSNGIDFHPGPGERDDYFVRCPICGDFVITEVAWYNHHERLNRDEIARAILSHAICRMRKLNKRPKLTSDLIDHILNTSILPTPAEQADNLVLFLGNETKPGKSTPADFPELLAGEVGAIDQAGVDFVINSARLKGWLFPPESFDDEIALTFEGWEHYHDLLRQSAESRKAFMAMQYGAPDLDVIVNDFFRPAVEQAGFTLRRLDDEEPAGLIDDRLRVEIRTSRFLIADLTHDNRGAYWEAGFAEGLGKPVIYTCERARFEDPNKPLHFDTNHHLTVLWEKDKPEEAAEKLKNTIRATLHAEAKMTDD